MTTPILDLRADAPDFRSGYHDLRGTDDPVGTLRNLVGSLPTDPRRSFPGAGETYAGPAMLAAWWSARGLLDASDLEDRRSGAYRVLALLELAHYLDTYGGREDVELGPPERGVTRTLPRYVVRSTGYDPGEIPLAWFQAVDPAAADLRERTYLARSGGITHDIWEAASVDARCWDDGTDELYTTARVFMPRMYGAAIFRGTDHVDPDRLFGGVWSIHT